MSGANAVTQTGGEWQQTKPFKFFAYVVGAIAVLLSSVVTDGINQAEWAQLLLAGVTAGTVWTTTNLPNYPRLKEITATVLTAANIGVSHITGAGITGTEWVNLGILALAVGGVVIIPNPVAATGAARGGRRGLLDK